MLFSAKQKIKLDWDASQRFSFWRRNIEYAIPKLHNVKIQIHGSHEQFTQDEDGKRERISFSFFGLVCDFKKIWGGLGEGEQNLKIFLLKTD